MAAKTDRLREVFVISFCFKPVGVTDLLYVILLIHDTTFLNTPGLWLGSCFENCGAKNISTLNVGLWLSLFIVLGNGKIDFLCASKSNGFPCVTYTDLAAYAVCGGVCEWSVCPSS